MKIIKLYLLKYILLLYIYMSNCSDIAKLILMVENPIYKHRLIISLLTSVLLSYFIIIKFLKVSKEILVMLVIVGTFGLHQLIEFLLSKFIDEDKLNDLVNKCSEVQKENFLNKLDNLKFENPKDKPSDVLDEKQRMDFNKRVAISLETINKNINKNISDSKDDVSEKFTNPSPFDSTFQKIETPPLPSPPAQVTNEDCLLGKDNCNPLCSGSAQNPCNLQTPSPGPQWQPQNATAVQNRLTNGQFVPNFCPL
jgi:hypothetical protein